MAGEYPSLLSGGLRNLLSRTFFEGDPTWTQPELLGLVGRLQVLIDCAQFMNIRQLHTNSAASPALKFGHFPRRGFVLQPRVAVLGYPGKDGERVPQPQRGCGQACTHTPT